MKPLQIGLLVLVGALGGAMIVKFAQRSQPVPVHIAAEAPVAVQPAPAAPPAVQPDAPPLPEKAEPAADSAPPKPVRRPKVARVAPVTRPAKTVRPAPVTIARNLPPAAPPEPEPPAPVPSEPVRAEPAPTPAAPAEPAPAPEPAPVAEPVEPPPAPSVSLKPGLLLPVRLGESLSSEHNQAGDTFTATLEQPLAADGFVIAERGARLEGRVVESQRGAHMKGEAALALELTMLKTSDGQRVAIRTDTFRKQAPKATGDDVGVVAAAAGVGAIIGAIAGGGKGAAIGAGAGGATGVGGVALSHAKAVNMPAETKVSFRLSQPVTITEHINRN